MISLQYIPESNICGNGAEVLLPQLEFSCLIGHLRLGWVIGFVSWQRSWGSGEQACLGFDASRSGTWSVLCSGYAAPSCSNLVVGCSRTTELSGARIAV